MTARRTRLPTGLVLGGTCLLLLGCGGQPPAPQGGTAPEVPVSMPAAPDPTKPDPPAPTPPTPPAVRDALHQPFAAAIRSADDPPADANRPPDTTRAGKGVFALYQQVQQEWDAIRFTTPDGKKILWTATIETDKGTVELAFFPEQAPNHVRNFLTLAKLGYFDGLCFERVHEEEVPGSADKFQTVEFGCPDGTGEPGNGSLGYWLKPEFNDRPHEPGTLGALRGNGADTAACRCYITLNKAGFLDGKVTVFGKVTRGLDVARIIFQQPVHADDASRPGSRRPAKPVEIRKITLHRQEA